MVSLRFLSAVLMTVVGINAAQNALQQFTGSFGANPNGVSLYLDSKACVAC